MPLHLVHSDRTTKIFGSLKTLIVEILLLCVIAYLNTVAGPEHRLYFWISALVVLLLIVLTLYLYRIRVKKQKHDELINRVVNRMSDHLVEILCTAWINKWEPLDEDKAYEFEEDKDVKKIWVLAPNFEGVLGCKKSTVVENACAGKKYKIIFPEDKHREYEELVSACEAHNPSSTKNLSGKCLLGRQMTPVELVICYGRDHMEPKHVYLYNYKAPKDKRILKLPTEPKKFIGDLTTTFSQLWEVLTAANHNH